jgi:adenosylhomocysteine nucleosidase
MESTILVCFAVEQEAAPFRKVMRRLAGVQVLVTGMGRRNAELAIATSLKTLVPQLVLTCGFAGGLNPALDSGTVIFSCANDTIMQRVASKQIRAGRFHELDRVATTAAEKHSLFKQTGADAVEMESGAITAFCVASNIPCAIVRVILDSANEDLPLDFNQLMNRNQEMNYWRLAAAIARSPSRIGGLLKLQKQSKFAAQNLAEALVPFLAQDATL